MQPPSQGRLCKLRMAHTPPLSPLPFCYRVFSFFLLRSRFLCKVPVLLVVPCTDVLHLGPLNLFLKLFCSVSPLFAFSDPEAVVIPSSISCCGQAPGWVEELGRLLDVHFFPLRQVAPPRVLKPISKTKSSRTSFFFDFSGLLGTILYRATSSRLPYPNLEEQSLVSFFCLAHWILRVFFLFFPSGCECLFSRLLFCV